MISKFETFYKFLPLRYGRLAISNSTDPEFFIFDRGSIFFILIIQTLGPNVPIEPVQRLQSNFLTLKIKR